ncbi:flavin monoamine oxidase family protein [Streptomyces sp. SID1121]|uniref:flavin monoamine oxidase family protein n=1 Tax=Streptomyces sp. SID1121 TaxID=3425888 RepID=UPI004056403C
MSSRPPVTHQSPPAGLGRRSLLKALGGTALAGGAVAAAAPAAASVRADNVVADVIVIGAGYAGGTAARELSAQGLNVAVVEARDRIGGRIWTDTFAGKRIELGGGWLSPDHHLVAAEFSRYGLTNAADVIPTTSVMPGANGGFDRLLPQDANAHLGELFDQFFAGSETYFERPNDPRYRSDLLAQLDLLSFTDRINQLGLSDVDATWLHGYFAAYTGGDNTSRAMTSMAQWWALGGWNIEGWEKQTAFKPTAGMTKLLQKMLDASPRAKVYLNSPVTAVTSTSSGVQVRIGSNRLFTGRAAVLATPVNTWKKISFNPGLPAVHAAATSEGVGVGLATKLWIHLAGDVEAVYAMGTKSSALPLMIPQEALSGGGRLMIGFAGSSLNVSDATAVQKAVREYIPGATVVGYRAHEWGRDPYALGGWGLRRPGQLLRQLPGIQQPHGRIAFAGGDIASGWNGAFVEGAVETGLRAAQQVAALIN